MQRFCTICTITLIHIILISMTDLSIDDNIGLIIHTLLLLGTLLCYKNYGNTIDIIYFIIKTLIFLSLCIDYDMTYHELMIIEITIIIIIIVIKSVKE